MTTSSRANGRQLGPDELLVLLGAWSAGHGPLYRQLAGGLERLVAEGVLRLGDRLPPERPLAECLAVSRGTVVAAYDLLRSDGAVERVQGSGTTVATGPTGTPAATTAAAISDPLFASPPNSIDLLKAVPAADEHVREIITSVDLGASSVAWDAAEPAGLPELRERIAAHYTEGGLPTSTEQVLVTTGAQQAVALVVQRLVARGDVAVTESVTWPGLADTVRRSGARLHGVPLDVDGPVVEDLAELVQRIRPTLIGMNPHHHNPTGLRLSGARRQLLADVSADHRVPVLEDRVASSLAFDGVVPPPLAALRPDAPTITVDSLSKVAWGGLRIGWIRTDAATVHDLRTSKALADLWSPVPSQLMALPLLDHHRLLARRRAEQLRRREALLTGELEARLPEWSFDRPRGGMVLWVQLPGGSASAFARFATRHGVSVASGREFSVTEVDDDHIRIPFTAPEPVLVDAVERLADAWAHFDHRRLDRSDELAAIV